MDFLEYFKGEIIKELTNHYNVFEKNNNEGSKIFLQIIKEYREQYLKFAEVNKLNHSSFGGILIEWIFKFAMDMCVIKNNKSDIIEIENKHKLKCEWKKKGNKSVNIDLAISDKDTKKLLTCLEIKTNFEDGFEKYFEEQEIIREIERKGYNAFKYHYISFTKKPLKFTKRIELINSIEILEKEKQIWILPVIKEEIDCSMIEKCTEMLNSLYGVIKNYS